RRRGSVRRAAPVQRRGARRVSAALLFRRCRRRDHCRIRYHELRARIDRRRSLPGPRKEIVDIRKVKKLIELLEESGIAEIEISEGEESVRISRYPPPATMGYAPPGMMTYAPPASSGIPGAQAEAQAPQA